MRRADPRLIEVIEVTDAKCLYDNLGPEQFTGTERRAALEIVTIRDSMKRMNGQAQSVAPSDTVVHAVTFLFFNWSTRIMNVRHWEEASC